MRNIQTAIRALRLRLARAVAPAGADLHDPDATSCPGYQALLEEVFAGRLVQGPGTAIYMNVKIDLEVADLDGWVTEINHEDGRQGWRLTPAGQRELGRLWGPHRLPPGTDGHRHCRRHGDYEVQPGQHIGCLSCAAEEQARRFNTEPAGWLARRRENARR